MMYEVLKERKEILLFLLMFITFTLIACVRVDNLEKNSISSANNKEIVYNR